MASPRVVGPHDGHRAILGGAAARLVIAGGDAGKRFAPVDHPMQPRALAAPMHRHHREDEYSFVLEGSIGPPLGDSVLIGNPGDGLGQRAQNGAGYQFPPLTQIRSVRADPRQSAGTGRGIPDGEGRWAGQWIQCGANTWPILRGMNHDQERTLSGRDNISGRRGRLQPTRHGAA